MITPATIRPAANKLLNDARIAPLWLNMNTEGPGNDIYVDTSASGQVTIRWQGTNAADGSQLDFAVVLSSDGSFRFDYGPGNTNVGSAVIGISAGNGDNYQLAGYTGQATLTDATSLLYSLQPGFADIGAYEFLGNSLATTSPTITAISPSAIAAGGTVTSGFNQIELTFSEPLNTIDANAPAAYELVGQGQTGAGTGTTVYKLVPQYTPGSSTVTLSVVVPGDGNLPSGSYELTVFGSALHDLSGLELAGSGTAGSNYVRAFSLVYNNTSPVISQIEQPPPYPAQPVDSITVTFSEAIDPATFTAANLSLTENGRPVTLGNSTITPDSTDTVFTISGLSAFDSGLGAYVLTASAVGVEDLAGNAGAGSVSVSWSMLPAPTVIAEPSNAIYTALPYAGESATVTGAGSAAINDGSLSYTYYRADDLTQALSVPPTAAGSYDVVAVFSGDAEYSGETSAMAPFTITRAPLTVTAQAASVAYGQPIPSLTGSTDGFLGSDGTSVTYSFTTTAQQDSLPGGYTISDTAKDPLGILDNYNVTYIPATLTITKAVPNLTVTGPSEPLVYDGTSDLTSWATALLAGVSGGVAPSGTATVLFYRGPVIKGKALGPRLAAPPVNAGTYNVAASYAGDANYLAATSSFVTFTISPAVVQNLAPIQSFPATGRTGIEHRRHGVGNRRQWNGFRSAGSRHIL